jgi:hypothetical protein
MYRGGLLAFLEMISWEKVQLHTEIQSYLLKFCRDFKIWMIFKDLGIIDGKYIKGVFQQLN